MGLEEIIKKLKKSWNWVWNSDSVLSWIVALALIFLFVKFVFFPSLSIVTGSSLPLAGVESSSMDHQIVKNDNGILSLCEETYLKNQKKHIDFDEYWEICGNWYERKGITKEEFSDFPLKNGFRKGDIIVVWGRFEPKIGDIIIFTPNQESSAPRPIIHRIIDIDDNGYGKIIQTKGDHNGQQLTLDNNTYGTDETNISEEQIIGKAVIKIPLLGWPKIWAVEFMKKLF